MIYKNIRVIVMFRSSEKIEQDLVAINFMLVE